MALENSSSNKSVDDEVDLLQLWEVLVKRKALVILFVVFCLLVGIGFTFLKPVTYVYSTKIEIASVNGKSLVSPQVMQNILKDVIIPRVRSGFADYPNQFLPVNVKVGNRDPFVTLSSRATLDKADEVKNLHLSILNLLFEEHRPKIEALRNETKQNLLDRLEKTKEKLVLAANQGDLLSSRLKRLNTLGSMLSQKVEELEAELLQAKAMFNRISSDLQNTESLLAGQMSRNHVSSLTNQLFKVRERLNISLIDEKEKLSLGISKNKLELSSIQREVESLQQEYADFDKSDRISDQFKNTQALLGVAVRSARPTGPGKSLVVALSATIGLILGVLLAFFAEFVSNTRNRKIRMTAST